jgi:hypothetical protein
VLNNGEEIDKSERRKFRKLPDERSAGQRRVAEPMLRDMRVDWPSAASGCCCQCRCLLLLLWLCRDRGQAGEQRGQGQRLTSGRLLLLQHLLEGQQRLGHLQINQSINQ